MIEREGAATAMLEVEVPLQALRSLRTEAGEFAREMRILAAVKLFELGRLSSGRAADLAGISRVEFLAILPRYEVGPLEYMTAEELHRDVLREASLGRTPTRQLEQEVIDLGRAAPGVLPP